MRLFFRHLRLLIIVELLHLVVWMVPDCAEGDIILEGVMDLALRMNAHMDCELAAKVAIF